MSHYPRWLESSSYQGHAGVRAFMAAWLGVWTDWEPRVEEAIDVDDRVLLVVHDRARIAGSSGAIERRYGHLLTFRAGRIVRSAIYQDLDDARRDIAS
jgi:ketosteroid isomerase-like protein